MSLNMVEFFGVLLITVCLDLHDSMNDRVIYIKADQVKIMVIADD